MAKKNGANDRNRTDDLFITSELLYRLSYIGILLKHNIYALSPFVKAGKENFTILTDFPFPWRRFYCSRGKGA